MEMITAKEYSFTYAGAGAAAVQDLSFEVHAGELILVAGDSGCGKSTFLKSLNGLIPEIVEGKLEGARFLGSDDMAPMPIYDISRRVGSVFQNPRSQFFTLNSTSELVFPMENYGYSREQMDSRLAELEKAVPIRKLMDREIFSLSSGERQLLALASALALSPDILLFDEPSANLDYHNAMRLKALLQKLKEQGKTIFVADHRYFYLHGVTDRVFLLRDHRLQVFDSEEAFRQSSSSARSFQLFRMDIPFREPRLAAKESAGVRHVSKWDVLKDVTIRFHEREIAALVGANGAGKTTLARILTRSLRPDTGEVETGGLPFYVMQDADYQLFGTSVESELEIGHKGLSEEIKKETLEKMGLWQYRRTHPFNLSGGEKQRLQIAVASLSEAGLVIFDEPTSGLDLISMERVAAELRTLARARTVLLISHDYEFIRRAADRVLYLHHGTIEQDFILGPDTVNTLNQIFINMEEPDETEI